MSDFYSASLSAMTSGPWAGGLLLLAKLTAVLAMAWMAHAALRNHNPRWRILLWRAASVGVVAVALLAVWEPLLTISWPVQPATETVEAARPMPPQANRGDHVSSVPELLAHTPAPPPMRPLELGAAPLPPIQDIDKPDIPPVTNDAPKPAKSWPLSRWLLLAWSIGVVLGLLRLAAGIIQVHRVRRRSRPVPDWIAREAVPLLSSRQRIELRQTEQVKTPCSVGTIRNTILLPSNLCHETHRQEIRAALAHEIAHFQGHDLHWNHLLHLLSILLWFHPLAWRIRLAHADACDQRCDAEAARQLGDSLGYGRALARLALSVSGRTTPVALSMARRSGVSRRIAILHSERGTRRLSRWRAMLATCAAGCLLLGIGAVALVPSRADEKATAQADEGGASDNHRESSMVRVVDPEGNPIAGATVVPWIIDSKEGNGAWGAKSHGDPPVLTTDDDGIAVIPFPPDLQGDQRLPLIDLYCRVSHPEFVATMSLYDAVPIPPETRDDDATITLQRGAVVEVTALADGEPLPVDDLYALTSTPVKTWARKITKGSDGKLRLPRLPAGPELLRIVHLPDDAPPLFSDVHEVELEIDEEHQLRVTMNPSIQVSGALGANVPRPIRNGRVVAVVWDNGTKTTEGKPVHEYILWRDSAKINENGTFTLAGMPSGQLQVIAICDGFMAKAGQRPKFARDEARINSGRPQVFDMSDGRQDITVEMVPTADASIHVVDPDGAPIEGASVDFSPNMHWWGGGSQIYGVASFGTAESIADPTVMRFPDREDVPFWAKTNAEGIALVTNLPPEVGNFAVYHENYDVPSDEINDGGPPFSPFDIELTPETRAEITVTLLPKEPQRRPGEPATSEIDGNSKFEFKKKVRVVDTEGNPIAGATVAPWAIRSQHGHGSWSKKGQGESEPPVLTTNADGIAVIPFPRYADSDEKIPPRELTCRVVHPDFAETMYNDVPVTPDKRDEVTTITLRPGAIVDILMEGHKVEEMSAEDLYALTSSPSKNWFRKVLLDDRGILHLPRIPAKEDLIRLVYMPDDEPPVFSNVVSLSFIEGERVTLMFDMERSVSVEGALSDNVPRPVKNGRVVAEVIFHDEGVGNISWRVWAKVNEDGSFTLDGLPRGDLQVIAICDGYMAEAGEPPEFATKKERRLSTGYNRPQVFELDDDVTPITVEMTPTGGARFRVLYRGEPVEGAKISLWPNVRWWGGGSQYYAEPLITTVDKIKRPKKFRLAAYANELFSATTQKDGIAFVQSLPPGRQTYGIQHDTLEMPLSEEDPTFRYDGIKVTASEVTDVTVRMQPRGTQPLEKRPANSEVPADDDKNGAAEADENDEDDAKNKTSRNSQDTEQSNPIVTATILDAETGEPVESGRVTPRTAIRLPDGERSIGWQSHLSRKFTDGHYEWPGERTYHEFQLRFAAAGYIPTSSSWMKDSEGPLSITIRMRRNPGIRGRVSQPDGAPAVGATLAVATRQHEVRLRDGKIVGGDGSPTETSRDDLEGPFVGETDENGRYQIPKEVYPGLLYVVHETGIAEIDFETLIEQPEIRLAEWASIDGRVIWNKKAGAGESMYVGVSRDLAGYPCFYTSFHPTTDAQGRFHVEKLPPGLVQISRSFDLPEDGSYLFPHKHVTLVTGKNQVIFGGQGRTVVGKIIGLDNFDNVTLSIAPNAPRPGWEKGWTGQAHVHRSNIGSVFFRGDIPIEADGTFRIEHMLPEYYQLFVRSQERGIHEVEQLRVAEGAADEPVDAGEIRIAVGGE